VANKFGSHQHFFLCLVLVGTDRETEKELQQATEDLGKASHKALDEEDSASFCKPVCCPGRSGSDRSAGRNAETTEGASMIKPHLQGHGSHDSTSRN